mmetsp:Transcript_46752/g.78485  ORF Transcript_46752/g.78485 Transcript_46752/m.78485 type:complete len:224 (+) Transcript_46752:559-1230(+)
MPSKASLIWCIWEGVISAPRVRHWTSEGAGPVRLALQAFDSPCKIHEPAGRARPVARTHNDGFGATITTNLLGCFQRSVVGGKSRLGIRRTRLAALLALSSPGEVDVATRRAPPIRCVLLRNVRSWRASRTRSAALLTLRSPGEVDIIALQALPVRRISSKRGSCHSSHSIGTSSRTSKILGSLAYLTFCPLGEVQVATGLAWTAPISRHQNHRLPGTLGVCR